MKYTTNQADMTAEQNKVNKITGFMEKLLDGVEVEWRALREVAEVKTGQKPREILDSFTEYDYINAGTSRSGYCNESNCEGDTVTTPSRGQGGIGYVGYQKLPFWLGPLCYKLRSRNCSVILNKYLFYREFNSEVQHSLSQAVFR
ncbi:MAG: restriction endonuclease subunit S [Marinobacterium sp.]|nr:restriction endonuclease subunit S [Marinobacterium sp.]